MNPTPEQVLDALAKAIADGQFSITSKFYGDIRGSQWESALVSENGASQRTYPDTTDGLVAALLFAGLKIGE